MFEGVISSILTKYLSRYVQNLNTEQLSMGLFGGDIELLDLEVRDDALDGMHLPLQVKRGAFDSALRMSYVIVGYIHLCGW